MICPKEQDMTKRFFLTMFILAIVSLSFYGCSDNYDDVIRIHIRAHSNSVEDQEVKLKVRDSVVDYITPLLLNAIDVIEVKDILLDNITNIEHVADAVPEKEGYSYTSSASINREYFPTRVYGEYSFPADYYEALIINLGSGTGDNWWCVAYPPLCFVGDGEGDVVYKSKILEIIERYFN